MYPEVHTLADANLRLERCGGTMLPNNATRATVFSSRPRTMQGAVIPLRDP